MSLNVLNVGIIFLKSFEFRFKAVSSSAFRVLSYFLPETRDSKPETIFCNPQPETFNSL